MSGAWRFEDMIVWQLAVELRDTVFDITSRGQAVLDKAFVAQIRDAARSAPDNIAEGFAKFGPPEFARYVNIAKGSIAETQSQLLHGIRQGYFSEADFTTAWRLACRTLRAANRLHAYLRRCGRHWPPRKPPPTAN